MIRRRVLAALIVVGLLAAVALAPVAVGCGPRPDGPIPSLTPAPPVRHP